MKAEPEHHIFPNKISHKLMQVLLIPKIKILSPDCKHWPLPMVDQPLLTLLNLLEKGLLLSIVSVRVAIFGSANKVSPELGGKYLNCMVHHETYSDTKPNLTQTTIKSFSGGLGMTSSLTCWFTIQLGKGFI